MSKQPQSELLVDIARRLFEFAQAPDGTPFALPVDGGRVARMFRGGRDGVRQQLAVTFLDDHGKPPTSSALADALGALEGIAARGPTMPLALRVARHDGDVLVDLGHGDGTVAVIDQDGWRLLEGGHPEVVFRHTALTAPMPFPKRGGDIFDLAEVANVTGADLPLMIAWAVSTLLAELPHPIVLLTGEQGSGKSMAARQLVGLLDPSTAPLRTGPRDLEQWAVAASGSWVVALDNISRMSDWLSDALCRAVTDDGMVRRRLYSDSDVSVLSFRRCVMLTSIDAGALRGDLAERLVMFELERLGGRRATEDDLQARWDRLHPQLLGALFDLTSRVLAVLDSVTLPHLPRMADFARVVAAVDQVMGTAALDRYLGQSDRIATDVLEGDPVGVELRALVDTRGTIDAPAGEILDDLNAQYGDGRKPRDWPGSPRAMSGHLTRLSPALRRVGIAVDKPDRDADGRRWVLTQGKITGKRPSQPSHRHDPTVGGNTSQNRHDGREKPTVIDRHETVIETDPTVIDRHGDLPLEPLNDGHDGHDGQTPVILPWSAADDLADPDKCSRCGRLSPYADPCRDCAAAGAA